MNRIVVDWADVFLQFEGDILFEYVEDYRERFNTVWEIAETANPFPGRGVLVSVKETHNRDTGKLTGVIARYALPGEVNERAWLNNDAI